MEKNHNYFYKITNVINGKYYYGIRSCIKFPELDTKYMGSGSIIKKAIDKYGKENFVKTIIADYPTRKEASDHEKLIVTEELIKNTMCYNSRTGGDNGYRIILSEEVRKRISKANSEALQGMSFVERYGLEKAELIKKKISSTHKKMMEENIELRNRLGNASRGGTFVTEEWLIQRKLLRSKQVITKESRIKAIQTRKNNGKPWFTEEAKHKMREKNWRTGQKLNEEQCKYMSKIADKRPCLIEGVYFESVAAVNKYYNFTAAGRRLNSKSERFKNWIYLTNREK